MSGVVGFPVTGMLAFDLVIIDLMNAYAVPGAALAVSRNGTIVIERGYGCSTTSMILIRRRRPQIHFLGP